MRVSLFAEFVRKVYPKLSKLIEKHNEKRKDERTYLHKTMLRREYSADQKWESASVNTTYVAADMVAMDSPLPIKKRDSIAHANGDLPKIGIKRVLREKEINAINVMRSRGASFATIGNKFVQDAAFCDIGIDERNEMNFLTALGDGYVLVPDEENTGTALRVKFNFLEENTFGVKTKGKLTLADIKNVLTKADDDGNSITTIAIAQATYDKLRATREARELVANDQGRVFTATDELPVPSAASFDSAFSDDTGGVKFLKIDRTIMVEKNGKRTPIKPFNKNKLTFLVDGNNVGAFVWGTLAEMTNPVEGVIYQTLDSYKLIAKFSKTDPLQEFTTGQALCLPVLENIDQIYSLEITSGETVNTVNEGKDTSDAKVTIGDVVYQKAGFIQVLNDLGLVVDPEATDEEVVAAYNSLTAANKKKAAAEAASYVTTA